MTSGYREECRLAALAAGYELGGEWDCAEDGILLGSGAEGDPHRAWHPKNLKSDSFDLLIAVLAGRKKNPEIWDELPEFVQDAWEDFSDAIESGDSSKAMPAIFDLAVAIGRGMEQKS